MRLSRADDSVTRYGLSTMETLALAVVLVYMPVQIYSEANSFLVVLAAVGTAALIGAASAPPWEPLEDSADHTIGRVFGLVGVALVVLVVADFHIATLFAPQFAYPLVMATVAAVTVGYVVHRTPATTAHRWLATLVILIALGTTAYAYLVGIAETNIDVFVLHRSAAEALAQGENPYVVAHAIDASPNATEGDLVIGYTYPPLTMLAYAMSQWLTGDPRWAGVLAFAIVVLLIASPWAAWSNPVARVRLSLPLLLVIPPGFGLVAFLGWTEPISLPFLLVASRFWRSKPVVSAVALGLAVATKQYFILALPLLLFWPGEWRWKRTAIVVAVASATMVPFLIADAPALFDSLLGNTAFSSAPRTDSANLIHLGIVTPRWVAMLLAAGLGVWLGRKGGEGYRFTLALAAVLGVAFFFGVAAFRNYWFLLTGMALIALADRYLVEEVPSTGEGSGAVT